MHSLFQVCELNLYVFSDYYRVTQSNDTVKPHNVISHVIDILFVFSFISQDTDLLCGKSMFL